MLGAGRRFFTAQPPSSGLSLVVHLRLWEAGDMPLLTVQDPLERPSCK